MRLTKVSVRNFRNFIDSTEVPIEPDVTCLIGKNESGKSAFLTALSRLNPARAKSSFATEDDYPAWLEKDHRHQGRILEDERPIQVEFVLDAEEMDAVHDAVGAQVLLTDRIIVARTYANKLECAFQLDEAAAAAVCLAMARQEGVDGVPSAASSLDELDAIVLSLLDSEDPNSAATGTAIETQIKTLIAENGLTGAVWNVLRDRIPQFFLFADYALLPYSASVRSVLAQDDDLPDELITMRSLLRLAASEDKFLTSPDYERRKRELENVANALTKDVKEYWTQNPELRVNPDITMRTVKHANSQSAVIDEIKLRIWDDRHQLSLPFNEHSAGFQWFFSFLAAFSEYERRDTPVVILLDEPAIGLHARAQSDFLRFIDERLAARHQVIYTTHSPFMIQPSHLSRVRTVEDQGPAEGSRVSLDVLSADRDTVFPLKGALGYDLAQHLFAAPHNLVVRGTSDYTYLRTISDFLKRQTGRKALDDRWSIVPVGGSELIPTFAALVGGELDITVIIDSKNGANQRLQSLATQGILAQNRIIGVGSIVGQEAADIEDLFVPDDYLMLFNAAIGTSVTIDSIVAGQPIVKQLSRLMKVERFDHGRPADYFLRNRDDILGALQPESITRFERLFEAVNATLHI